VTDANPFVKVWSEQDYRRLSVLMLVAGVAVSSAIPLVTLFLTEALGVGEAAAGLFFLTSLGAPLINLYTGALSDRMESRVPLVRGIAVWLALGWALMSLSSHPAMVFAVGVVFVTFIGALNAQIFAVLRDVVERNGERREASVMSTVRTGYSFGWTLGPVLGSLVAGWAGYRLAFALTAVLFLSALIPLAGLRVRRTQRDNEGRRGTGPARPKEKPGVRLAVFGLVCLLVLSGETVRLAYLPIFATDRLGMGLGQFGALMAVAPLTELAVMPLAGVLADRVGLSKVLVAGFTLGACGYVLFGGGGSVWSLYLGQVLHACMIAVVFGIGVTYAQRLSPGSAGLAGSVFFSAQSLSALTGSLLGSGGVWLIGLPGMFFVPAALLAAACGLFVWNDRSRKKEITRRNMKEVR